LSFQCGGAITHTGRVIRARPNQSLQRTRLRRGSTGRSLSQAFGLAAVRVYHRRAAELNRWAVCSSLRNRSRERKPSFKVTRIDSSTSSWFFSGSASRQRHIVTPWRTPRPHPSGAASSPRYCAPRQKGRCLLGQTVSALPASAARQRVGDDCRFNTSGL